MFSSTKGDLNKPQPGKDCKNAKNKECDCALGYCVSDMFMNSCPSRYRCRLALYDSLLAGKNVIEKVDRCEHVTNDLKVGIL